MPVVAAVPLSARAWVQSIAAIVVDLGWDSPEDFPRPDITWADHAYDGKQSGRKAVQIDWSNPRHVQKVEDTLQAKTPIRSQRADDEQFSKCCSDLLRHKARHFRRGTGYLLNIDGGGYVSVLQFMSVLRHQYGYSRCTLLSLLDMARNNNKGRYDIYATYDPSAGQQRGVTPVVAAGCPNVADGVTSDDTLDYEWRIDFIRCINGHSIDGIEVSRMARTLSQADIPKLVPCLYHGTAWAYAVSIMQFGLLPGGRADAPSVRNDVRLCPEAPWDPIHNDKSVRGARKEAEVQVFVDVNGGVELIGAYIASNGVVFGAEGHFPAAHRLHFKV